MVCTGGAEVRALRARCTPAHRIEGLLDKTPEGEATPTERVLWRLGSTFEMECAIISDF
jgi:hypothetical protein